MQIEPFGVEEWMNAWETRCRFNLAETCVASLTVAEVLAMADKDAPDLSDLLPMKLTYGAIQGSVQLREAIAGLYRNRSADEVIVTHGAIGANALVYAALVRTGDHVVSIVPSYQQHTSIPRSLGARVTCVDLVEADGYRPDWAGLEAALAQGARLVTLTNPNNPTGALLDEADLSRIARLAEAAGAHVLCDEVYRGTDEHGDGTTASIADLTGVGISTGSMSKAFSLAGLRLGWVVAPEAVRDAVMIHRDYTTISVGMLDDHFATIALAAKDRILDRSRQICSDNRAVLAAWVLSEPAMSYVAPASGTTALLRYEGTQPSYDFCRELLREQGVLLTPGLALGVEGTVRIGYANDTAILRDGLRGFSAFLAKRKL